MMFRLSNDWTPGFRFLAASLAGVLALGAVSTLAQDASSDTSRPASIHLGTCESPGEVVVELGDLVVMDFDRDGEGGSGEFVGAADASVVEGSEDSEFNISLDTLLAEPHVIAVFESERSDAMIACGSIGGIPHDDDDDDLAVGLRQQNDSGFAGIAFLDDDDDDNEVEVDLYIARDVI